MNRLSAVFDLEGHRGARGLWPENTLAGFARTLQIGVTTLELDVALTADGVVVVSHDPELNPDHTRDADGRFLLAAGPRICTLNYRDLLTYDVGRLRPGSAYESEFPHQVPVDGERIPRLTEVLDLVRQRTGGRVRVNIEVKTNPEHPARSATPEQFARALKNDIRDSGAESDVIIQAFDWRVLQAVRETLPEVELAALTDQQPGDDTVWLGRAEPSPWLGGLRPEAHGQSVVQLVKAIGAATWAPDYRDLQVPLVQAAHALGLRVVPWTVNSLDDMERLIAMRVDGIITDYPNVLRALLIRLGLEVPAPPRLEP